MLQRDLAIRFHRLHKKRPLVLPNAWDVASARLVEEAGADAIGTTSAGVSWSLGASDGEGLARGDALGLVARIVEAVAVPVSADIEAGYGETDDELAETISGVLAAGAVGINIEDSHEGGLRPVAAQANRISICRQVADSVGVPLFVNARIDSFFHADTDGGATFSGAIGRADAYISAGADGIFVPGVSDAGTIRRLVRAIPSRPLNVMVGPGSLPVGELAELGCRRVSCGMAISQASYGLAYRSAGEMLSDGTYESMVDGLGYSTINGLMMKS